MKRREFLLTPLALAACATPSTLRLASGWAGADRSPIAAVEHERDVRTRAELDAALALGDAPKRIRIHGVIDLSGGQGAAQFADRAFDFAAYCRAYAPESWGRKAPTGKLEDARKRSAMNQGAAVIVRIPPCTELIGATPDAGFADGMLFLLDAHDVALRNLHLHGVRDHFPAWDPLDGADGEWNAGYDALSLSNAHRVWVDHCRFESRYRARERVLGRLFETNDGLLDITRSSNLVTISWCHFANHDKTMLIGGHDRHVEDEGHLRVTLHHNLWERCSERTPRVRYGRVHVVNNLFVLDPATFGYSIGLGRGARIVSEDNAWEGAPGIDDSRLVRPLGGTQFSDRGSIRDGRRLALGAALRRAHPDLALDERPSFEPPPVAGRVEADQVASIVRAGAGPVRW